MDAVHQRDSTRPCCCSADGDRTAGAAMLLEIALVVLLGPVERRGWGDLSDDLPPSRLLLGVACCDREFLLVSIMIENRRAVLAAHLPALAVAGGRIVDSPERFQQLGVTDLGRVEPYLDGLGVAGAVPADPLVGRVRDSPAGVADGGLQHPADLAEGRLDAPEASRGECRALGSVRAVARERRCQRQASGGVPVPDLNQTMPPRFQTSAGYSHGRSARTTARGRPAPPPATVAKGRSSPAAQPHGVTQPHGGLR